MRIAFTLHTEKIEGAGAPTVVITLAEHLRQRGHETSVTTLSDVGHLPPRFRGIAFPWILAARVRREPLDVIDASTGDAWLLARMRTRSGPLLVTHSHGLEQVVHDALMADVARGRQQVSWKYPIYNGGFRLWEVRQSLVHADLCLFLNSYDATYAVERLGVSPARAKVVPNGCDDVLLDHVPAIRRPTDGLRIVVLGSYLARKGVRYVADAMNAFLAQNPKSELWFLGAGVDESIVYADYDPAVRDRVKVTQRFNRADLPVLLANQHVLLFASLAEGFPLSLLEGMACGLAPVATDIPGPTEVITSEMDALIVPPANSDALRGALERLARDPALLENLRIAARRTAERYRWSAIAEARESLYREAIKRRQEEIRQG